VDSQDSGSYASTFVQTTVLSASQCVLVLHCVAVLALFLGGCDDAPGVPAPWKSDETTRVILTRDRLILSARPVEFQSISGVKVVGTISGVCLSLRGDIPLRDAQAMAEEFYSNMRTASVRAVVTVAAGQKVILAVPSQSWSEVGQIAKHNELAACVRGRPGDLPIGTSISSIEITAASRLEVEGVYWESTNVFDEAKPR